MAQLPANMINPFCTPDERGRLLEGLVVASLTAGAEIMRIFHSGFEVSSKSDASPVTAADHAAEAILLEALAQLAPGIVVVAEEEAAAGRIPEPTDRFFLVDPLDGTKEFVRRGSDFTVNVGLVELGVPTLGVVYAPARGQIYVGDVLVQEAWTQHRPVGDASASDRVAMRVSAPAAAPTAVASKSHDTPQTEAYLQACGVSRRVSIGSSLKFCLLAAGEADLYPRAGPTAEWDTAAGQAVLEAAGGQVYDLEGAPFRYGKLNYFNPGFVAVGGLRGLPSMASVVGLDWL